MLALKVQMGSGFGQGGGVVGVTGRVPEGVSGELLLLLLLLLLFSFFVNSFGGALGCALGGEC